MMSGHGVDVRGRRWLVTGGAHIAVQLVFLSGLYAVSGRLRVPGPGPWRTLALVLLVGVPGVVWPVFFYLRDRRAPEPARHVVAAFLAGMAAAGVVALPVERDLFQTGAWIHVSPLVTVLGAMLIRGTLASLLLALLVRHGFAPLPEFDEPVDGTVYGAFAGAGFATVASLALLVDYPALALLGIGATAALNVSTYASVGALVGYLAGRVRFVQPPPSLLPALLVGVLLTGLYQGIIEVGLGQARPLGGAIAAALALSVIVLGVAARLASRLAAVAPPTALPLDGAREGAAWVVALLFLVAAGGLAHLVTRERPFASPAHGLAFRYAPTWIRPEGLVGVDGRVPALATPVFVASGEDGGVVTLAVSVRDETVELAALDPAPYLVAASPIALVVRPLTVAGRGGLRAQYVRLDPGDPVAGALPQTRWVYSDVVPGPGRTVIFTLEGPPATFARQARRYEALLASLQWTGP